MGRADIVVGAQWGDEGKGRWVQRVANDYAVVVRFQGGNNAGHTIYHRGQKVVLHHLPSGILSPRICCALSSGVVINPIELEQEIRELDEQMEVTPHRLWISPAAHIISPWHVYQDHLQEQEAHIGTTGRGIGPAYGTRALRLGLRLGDYCDPKRREDWLRQMQKERKFQEVYAQDRELWEKFNHAAQFLQDFVVDADTRVRERIFAGNAVLCEGAQGVLLDLSFGTYPFVTSSSTLAAAALVSIGIPPRYCGRVHGIAKAYLTRVGSGPFPTEITHTPTGKLLQEKGAEFGATTQRPRRVGWLDCVALKYSQCLNGFDGIVLNKLDILSELAEIKLCVAYEYQGQVIDFPYDCRILEQCKPVYHSFSGWEKDIPRRGKISDLPTEALTFLQEIEKWSTCKIVAVGTGVEANDLLAG